MTGLVGVLLMFFNLEGASKTPTGSRWFKQCSSADYIILQTQGFSRRRFRPGSRPITHCRSFANRHNHAKTSHPAIHRVERPRLCTYRWRIVDYWMNETTHILYIYIYGEVLPSKWGVRGGVGACPQVRASKWGVFDQSTVYSTLI